MTSGTRHRREQAAADLAAHLAATPRPPPAIDSETPLIEDDRTKWRRRLQQKRCLVCGAAQLHNRTSSYFCSAHLRTHRYCSTCETLRTIADHGKDSRCKPCASARALANYHAYPDKRLYRLRLKELSRRTCTRADQIFDGIRRRIALAAFVKRTPGLTWKERGALAGVHPGQLEASYWRQIRPDRQDADASDHARNLVLKPR